MERNKHYKTLKSLKMYFTWSKPCKWFFCKGGDEWLLKRSSFLMTVQPKSCSLDWLSVTNCKHYSSKMSLPIASAKKTNNLSLFSFVCLQVLLLSCWNLEHRQTIWVANFPSETLWESCLSLTGSKDRRRNKNGDSLETFEPKSSVVFMQTSILVQKVAKMQMFFI